MIRNIIIALLVGYIAATTLHSALIKKPVPVMTAAELQEHFFILSKDKWEGTMFDNEDFTFTQFERKDYYKWHPVACYSGKVKLK